MNLNDSAVASESSQSIATPQMREALVIGTVLLAVSWLVYAMLPVVLGAAADSLSLTHLQTGYLGSVYMVGFAGTPLATPFWARRVKWRPVLIVALVLVAGSFTVCALAETFFNTLWGMLAAGIGAGVLFSLGVIVLGDTVQPERAFVVGQTGALLLAAIGIWLLPVWIIPQYGFAGVLWVMVAVVLAVLLLAPWFPQASVKDTVAIHTGTRPKSALPIFLGMTGIGLYYLGLAGLWSFLERIGRESDLDAHAIGEAFSFEKVGALVVCAAMYWQGKHFGRSIPLLLGCGGMVLATFMLSRMDGPYVYIVAVVLFGAFWTYSFPFQVSVVTAADRDGRYSGVIPAFIGIGSTLGPTVAGSAVKGAHNGNYLTVYVLMALSCVMGTALLLATARSVRRYAENPVKRHAELM
jgi:MFS transporter, DHA1 family, inner membrane transport protein